MTANDRAERGKELKQEVLYLKIHKNILLRNTTVHLKDIGEIHCIVQSIANKVKTMRLPTEQIKGPGRYVFSVFDVIEEIQKEYPDLTISNLGETDFILTVEEEKRFQEVLGWIKTILVCGLCFFGAAFSIMAFNNDINVTKLFAQLYEIVTGSPSDGFTMLEVSYSIGVGMGILIFFHHFSKKRGLSDPTPLEVEMRTYEDEIDQTIMETAGRKGS